MFPAQGKKQKRKCEPLRLVLSKGSGRPAKGTRVAHTSYDVARRRQNSTCKRSPNPPLLRIVQILRNGKAKRFLYVCCLATMQI